MCIDTCFIDVHYDKTFYRCALIHVLSMCIMIKHFIDVIDTCFIDVHYHKTFYRCALIHVLSMCIMIKHFIDVH